MFYRKIFLASLLLSLLFPSILFAQVSDDGLRYFPFPRHGVLLGQGWDSVKGKPSSDVCIDFQEKEIASHETSTTFRKIINRYHLDRMLKISASASYKAGFGSVSGSANFSRERTINQNRQSMIATISVLSGSRFVAPKFLNNEFHPVALTQKILSEEVLPPEFRARCGDSFVAYIEKGGELNGIFSFNESQRVESEAFALTLKAKAYGAKGSLSAEGRTAIDTSQKYSDINVVQLGGPRLPAPIDAENFNNTIRAFTSTKEEFEERAFRVAVIPYSTLHNGQKKSSLPEFQNFYLLHGLMEELLDSYREILLGFESAGGIINVSLVDGEHTLENKVGKYHVVGRLEHTATSAAAVNSWRKSNRIFEIFKADYPLIYGTLQGELTRFSQADKVYCNRVSIPKLGDVNDTATLRYLLYLDANQIKGHPDSSMRATLRVKLRNDVLNIDNLKLEAKLVDAVFSKTNSGEDDGGALIMKKIDQCLTASETHPWNISEIEKTYYRLEAYQKILSGLIDNCLTHTNSSERTSNILDQDVCSEFGALEKYLSSYLPQGLAIRTQQIFRRRLETKTENLNEDDDNFWNRVAKRVNLSLPIGEKRNSAKLIRSKLITDIETVDFEEKKRSAAQSRSYLEAIGLEIAEAEISRLCDDNGVLPCVSLSESSRKNSILFDYSNRIDGTKNTDWKLNISTFKNKALSTKIKVETNVNDDANSTLAKRYLDQVFGDYYRYLYRLPLAHKSFVLTELQTVKSDISESKIDRFEADLNRFIYRVRIADSLEFTCGIANNVDICGHKLSVVDQNLVSLPALIGQDERSHHGCKNWAVRTIRVEDGKNWRFKTKWKNVDERYCAAWGKIVDTHSFIQLSNQLSRSGTN